MHWNRMNQIAVILISICLFVQISQAGTTGKIAGQVTARETGEPLPGANVLVAGTTLGAASDMNGNYTILRVPPGVYDLQVSVIGYTKHLIQDIRVNIDQTSRIDAVLQIEAIEGEAVAVIADRNVIREDVATSVVAFTGNEVAELPLSTVEEAVGLQAPKCP